MGDIQTRCASPTCDYCRSADCVEKIAEAVSGFKNGHVLPALVSHIAALARDSGPASEMVFRAAINGLTAIQAADATPPVREASDALH